MAFPCFSSISVRDAVLLAAGIASEAARAAWATALELAAWDVASGVVSSVELNV